MNDAYLCGGETAQKLYRAVRELPIYDYHCHLSPKEIWEDRPFDNIGEMWLAGDHYKWRLMRAAGIPEEKITGPASWHDKFLAYAAAIAKAPGNPLEAWTQMELALYFHIEEPLTPQSAEAIWGKANRVIREETLSPRRLILASRVAFIATTDDVADPLTYHEKLREETGFPVRVTPSFRTDRVLSLQQPDYPAYLARLEAAAGQPVKNLAQLKTALQNRLDLFVSLGCRFSDVGLPAFPTRIGDEKEADAAFCKAARGETVKTQEWNAFLGHMYVFLGGEYRRRNLVMQWHLAPARNVNTDLFRRLGPDTGGDCIGDAVSGEAIARVLDAVNEAGGLPETILYALNPGMAAQLASIAGSFPRVRCGAAWWFCDHKRGIENELMTVAETGCLGTFLGMLTDSRSFLSYARHDYFRRILCGLLGRWVDADEITGAAAQETAEAVSCGNIRRLIGGTI